MRDMLVEEHKLPERWRKVQFGDIATFMLGRTPSRSESIYWNDGKYPWVSIADMTEYEIISETKEKVSEIAYQQSFRGRLVPAGTLLMSFKLTIGRTSVLGVDAFHNEAIISIFPTEEVDRDYLMFALSQVDFNEHQDRAVKGNTLNKDKIVQISIPLPPLPEQRAIAHALRTVQAARKARQREAALERERKAALMQRLFTKGTRSEPTKTTEIGEVPTSWGIVALATVAHFESGGTPSKEREDWWQGNIPWISPKDLKKPRLADVTDHITEEALAEGSRLAPKGAIFIVVRGMILAKDVPVAIADMPMAFNQDLKAITTGDRLLPDFLLYTLTQRKENIGRLIGTSAHGTKRIGTSALEEFIVPIPPLSEQRTIAEVLRICDERIAALEREAAAHDELFKALLEELMTGRLRATELIDSL